MQRCVTCRKTLVMPFCLPHTHTNTQINIFVFPYPSSKGTSPLLQYVSVQRLKTQDEASSQAFMWKVFQFFSRASSLLLSNVQSECFGASEHHCSRSNPPLSSPLFFFSSHSSFLFPFIKQVLLCPCITLFLTDLLFIPRFSHVQTNIVVYFTAAWVHLNSITFQMLYKQRLPMNLEKPFFSV